MRIQHLLRTMASHSLARRDTADAAAPHEVVNYAPMLLWAIWVLTIVSGLLLGLRVYCRLTRNRALWWDDYFLILSWVRRCLTPRCGEVDVADEVGTLDFRAGFHGYAYRGHEMGHRAAL